MIVNFDGSFEPPILPHRPDGFSPAVIGPSK